MFVVMGIGLSATPLCVKVKRKLVINFLKKIISSTLSGIKYNTFLSPWYFRKSSPKIGHGFIWKYNKKEGIFYLFRKQKCFGLVDNYCYIQPISETLYLIWERGTTKIALYDSNSLIPLEKFNFKDTNNKYYFNCKPIEEINYLFDLYQTEIDFEFPESFKIIDEILQVNDLDGFYKDYKEWMNNTVIVSLKPKKNKINIYPQNWFNLDKSIDGGYQWITRAERNKKTNKIHIDGIRINNQILDDSYCDII